MELNAANEFVLADVPELSRYESRSNGELAGLIDYRLHEDLMIITHTETRPEFRGRGVAARITTFALDDARSRGLSIAPECPYTAAFVGDRPEYADLVRS